MTGQKKLNETLSKYRSRLEIISLMLGILARGPTPKSRLMYGAYLSYEQATNYIDYLLSKELMRVEQNGDRQPLFSLTEKGLKVLRVSETISELLQPPRGEEENRQRPRHTLASISPTITPSFSERDHGPHETTVFGVATADADTIESQSSNLQ